MTVLVWFRRDLRLHDNPALLAAEVSSKPVAPVFIYDEEEEGEWGLGGATKWWLHHSLNELDNSLRKRGSRLIILKGECKKLLPELARSLGATHLFYNERYEPAARTVQADVTATMTAIGVATVPYHGTLLREPWANTKPDGTPYKVYTAFQRAFSQGASSFGF